MLYVYGTMDSQAPPPGGLPSPYSADGRWYWDGSRWLPVPPGGFPVSGAGVESRRSGIGDPTWAPPPVLRSGVPPAIAVPAAAPVAAAPAPARPRPRLRLSRRLLVTVASVLAALVVIGASVGTVAEIRHQQSAVPSSHPSADTIFEMPFWKGVRSARFYGVTHAVGTTWTESGTIDFGPQHAFDEKLTGKSGVFEHDVVVGGSSYQTGAGSSGFQATTYESEDFRSIGWDGGPPPMDLSVVGQTTIAGQVGWVLRESASHSEWIVGEQTGDPLQVVIDGHAITFSHWGHGAAIKAPSSVSTQRYSGAAGTPVKAPAATVSVVDAQVDSGATSGGPAGFRTIAIKLSYTNDTSSASNFDDSPSLVTSDGVFAYPDFTTMQPQLNGGAMSPGQTVVGWNGFLVPDQATQFHLLFGPQLDQIPDLDYLISISVQVPR